MQLVVHVLLPSAPRQVFWVVVGWVVVEMPTLLTGRSRPDKGEQDGMMDTKLSTPDEHMLVSVYDVGL